MKKEKTPVDKITKKQLKLARRKHRMRSRRSRKLDEKKKGRIPRYFETWLKHPDKYDLPGVDTPDVYRKRLDRMKYLLIWYIVKNAKFKRPEEDTSMTLEDYGKKISLGINIKYGQIRVTPRTKKVIDEIRKFFKKHGKRDDIREDYVYHVYGLKAIDVVRFFTDLFKKYPKATFKVISDWSGNTYRLRTQAYTRLFNKRKKYREMLLKTLSRYAEIRNVKIRLESVKVEDAYNYDGTYRVKGKLSLKKQGDKKWQRLPFIAYINTKLKNAEVRINEGYMGKKLYHDRLNFKI